MKGFFDWLRLYAAKEAKPLKPGGYNRKLDDAEQDALNRWLEKKFAAAESDEQENQ